MALDEARIPVVVDVGQALPRLRTTQDEVAKLTQGVNASAEAQARLNRELRQVEAALRSANEQLHYGATGEYAERLRASVPKLEEKRAAIQQQIGALQNAAKAEAEAAAAAQAAAADVGGLTGEVRTNAEAQEQLRQQIILLNAQIAEAQKHLRSLSAEQVKQRQEALANVASLQQERAELQRRVSVLNEHGRAANRSNIVLMEGGRIVSGLTTAHGGLGQALVSSSHGAQGLVMSFRQLAIEQGSARAALGLLLRSFTGIGGLLLVLQAAAAAFAFFRLRAKQAFDESAEAAKEAQRAYEDALGAVLRFEFKSQTFTVTTEAQARALQEAAEAEVKRLEERRRLLESLETTVAPSEGGTVADATAATAAAVGNMADQIESLSGEIGEYQKIADRAAEAVQRFRAEATLAERLPGLGLDADPAKASKEVERLQARLLAEIASLRERTQIEILEEERARELAAVEQTLQERLALVREAAAREVVTREEAAILATQAEQAATLRRTEINRKYAEEARKVEEAYTKRLRELERERRQIAGESLVDILREEFWAAELRLALLDEGTEAFRAAYLERLRIGNALSKALQAAAEENASTEIREQNRVLREKADAAREEERLLRQRERAWERFMFTVFDALERALRLERRYTDTSVELTHKRFDEEREALEERQRLGEDVSLELRRLAEERAEFEKAAAEDAASATTKAALGALEVVRQAAIDYIKAELAKAAAAQLKNLFSSPLPLPISLGLAGGAIAAIFALEGAIRSAAGFAHGGFVGQRGEAGADTVPAMLGRGEAVLNRHQQRYVEDALRQTYGFGLDGLFSRVRTPHYAGLQASVRALATPPARFAQGGFATGAPSGAALLDAEAIVRELRIVRRELSAVGDRITGSVGDPHAARRLRRLAERHDRLTDPRQVGPRRGSRRR